MLQLSNLFHTSNEYHLVVTIIISILIYSSMHFVLFEVHVFLPITPVSGRIERNIRANVEINEGSSDLFSFHLDYFSQVFLSTFRLSDNERRGDSNV